MEQSYANPTQVIPVAAIDVDARARFIIRTYIIDLSCIFLYILNMICIMFTNFFCKIEIYR